MKIINWFVNTSVSYSMFTDYQFFMKHIAEIPKMQKNILFNILKKNKDTVYGYQHQFRNILSISDFQQRIPIIKYNDISCIINSIRNGEKNLLTSEEIFLLEPTGGTSGGTKLIPYTQSLKNEFKKAINTWIYDLYKNITGLKIGKSYWSISPHFDPDAFPESRVKIGFSNDAQYLGFTGMILKKSFAVPDEIKFIKKYDEFKYITSYFLLKEKEIALISIWNPSFLLLMLEEMEKNCERIIKDIFDGKNLHHKIDKLFFKKDRNRALELEKIFSEFQTNKFELVWKNLKLISCWADGEASLYFSILKNYFKNIYVQPKGIIATEGIISFPLIKAKGSVISYTSHFYEFVDVTDNTIKLIHELKQGNKYKVILTTGGGLYRYALEDIIIVKRIDHYLPIIEFVNRDHVYDFTGEKMAEDFILSCFNRIMKKNKIRYDFYLFSIKKEHLSNQYILFLETRPININKLNSIETALETEFRKNFYYDYAIKLNQLSPLKLFIISGNGRNSYIKRCIIEGQKPGDIKPVIFDKKENWDKYFEGFFLTKNACSLS